MRLILTAVALSAAVGMACAQQATQVPAWSSAAPDTVQRAITWSTLPGQVGSVPTFAKTMHEGGESRSKAYPSLSFMGKVNREVAPEAKELFVFFVRNEEDRSNVNAFLTSVTPRGWERLPEDSPWRARMTPRRDFVRVPVTDDGHVVLILDELEHPGCTTELTSLIVADGDGNVLDRLDRR